MSDGPRIPPLDDAELPGTLPQWNIFRTLERHPELHRKWLRFGAFLLGDGGVLPPRDRELLILRVAVRCGSSYEWGQHVRIALACDVTREEIDRVPAGPDAPGWSAHEATLLRFADELHDTANVSDATWAAMSERYDEQAMIEATMLVGQYHMVAFALNTFGVELDEGLEPLP